MTAGRREYKHLFTFDHDLYFRPLSEKEGGFLSSRLATSDSLVLKNVRFFAKRYVVLYIGTLPITKKLTKHR